MIRADENPFPGLRPFDQSDGRVFFGRDDQVDKLLDRLERDRLIAVVGSSASGKSSLVRAGLLPALYGGHLMHSGSRWRVVVMRPGARALASLADALDEGGVLGGGASAPERIALARTQLESGERGLIELVERTDLRARENLLLVVDQFEELFRFRGDREDAPAFVKLLLAATAARDVPIFVLLTMRADFIGDCSMFRDLPEAIGDGLFLVPRLSREQLREAIEGPFTVAGADISPVLVTQLLNELGDSPDQLPVLQHALMRAWDIARERNDSGELGADEFAATGGLARALSIHGDAIYDALTPAQRAAAERIFRALTDRTVDERGVRRPASVAELIAISGSSAADVRTVIERFRASDASFLMPPTAVPLGDETVVDISHESLMRVWTRLAGWAEDEARSARTYRRIADAAELHERREGALAIDPALSAALAWRETNAPTAAWAERYDPGSFERAMRYLDASEQRRRDELAAAGASRRRRTLALGGVTFAVLVIALACAALLAVQRERGALLIAQSRALAREAQAAIDEGDATTGELLALAALPRSIAAPDRPLTSAALHALARAYTSRRELVDLTGHTRVVYRVDWSPDGRYLVTASADKTARVWDARTYKLLAVLRDHAGYVSSAAFSPDSRLLATTSGDHTARIWDLRTFKTIAIMRGDTDYLLTAKWSPDGRRILTSSYDGTARIWDVRTGKQLLLLRAPGDYTQNVSALNAATYSPDGRIAVTASGGGFVRAWDARTGRLMHSYADGSNVELAVYSPDGRRLAFGDSAHHIRFLDARTFAPIGLITLDPSTIYGLAYSPDGRVLAAASNDGSVRLFDARTGGLWMRLNAAKEDCWSVAFAPDGRRLIAGTADSVARVWDSSIPAPVREFRASTKAVWGAVMASDGSFIVTFGPDGFVRIWRDGGGTPAVLRGDGAPIYAATVSPDGRRIVAGTDDGIMFVWDGRTGTRLYTIGKRGAPAFRAFAFSPDGRSFVSGGDDARVRLWNVADGKPLAEYRGLHFQVNSIAMSRDGTALAAAEIAGPVRMWNRASRRLEAVINEHDALFWSLAFSRDGSRLMAGSDDAVGRVWDVATGALVVKLVGHAQTLRSVDFSPDGSRIVTGSEDGTARIWDAATGDPLDEIQVRAGRTTVQSASFVDGGRSVLLALGNGVVQIRRRSDPPVCQALIDAASREVPRRLSHVQRERALLDSRRGSPLENAFMGGASCSP